jgi:antitoxin (DNA-binding transcriptional repressor) of toxin-antitoxin stability system
MSKEIIHISDVEAAKDFASLLTQVHAGAEIVIEHNAQPFAVIRPIGDAPAGRLLSESIALAEAHAKEGAFEPVMDPEKLHGFVRT